MFQVTGSNKGIGFAIVRALCKQFQGDVFLTSRDEGRGKEAQKALEGEGLAPKFHQLDIDDKTSIERLRDFLKDQYGGLDILVNNAGIAYKQASSAPFAEQAEETVKTNFFSTATACEVLFPLLRPHTRVVNMSGLLSKMAIGKCGKELCSRLTDSELSLKELKKLMSEFVRLHSAVAERRAHRMMLVLGDVLVLAQGSMACFNGFLNTPYAMETLQQLPMKNAVLRWLLHSRYKLEDDRPRYYMGKCVPREERLGETHLYTGTFLHRVVAFCDPADPVMISNLHGKVFSLLHDQTGSQAVLGYRPCSPERLLDQQKPSPGKDQEKGRKEDLEDSLAFEEVCEDLADSHLEKHPLDGARKELDLSPSLYIVDSFGLQPLQWAVLMNDALTTYLLLLAMVNTAEASPNQDLVKDQFRDAVRKAFHTMMTSPLRHQSGDRPAPVYDLLFLALEPAGLSVRDFSLMDAMPSEYYGLIKKLIQNGIRLVSEEGGYPHAMHPVHYAVQHYTTHSGLLILNLLLKRCYELGTIHTGSSTDDKDEDDEDDDDEKPKRGRMV
ncbi:hypothetical protein ACOMHN_032418 [Nucella lapillus]